MPQSDHPPDRHRVAPDRLHDRRAEAAALGACLLSPTAFDTLAAAGVTDAAFTAPALRAAWRGLERLAESGAAAPADPVALADELDRTNDRELAGDVEGLAALAEQCPAAANAARYGAILLDRARARALDHAARLAIHELGAGAPVREVQARLLEAGDDRPADDARCGSIKQFLRAGAGLEAAVGLPWPWTALQRETAGLPDGAVTVIGAKSGVGKTSFAAQALVHFAAEQLPVGFVSMEMSAPQLCCSMIARWCGVNAHALRYRGYAQLPPHAQKKIEERLPALSALPLHLYCRSGTAAEIAALMRVWARRENVRAVVIDYFQILASPPRSRDRRQDLEAALVSIKAVAQEQNLAVMLLSQLTKTADNAAPQLSDLRETGQIENVADAIYLLSRPNKGINAPCEPCGGVYGRNPACQQCEGTGAISQDTVMHVHVGKDKFGGTGQLIKLAWHGPSMTLSNYRQGEL